MYILNFFLTITLIFCIFASAKKVGYLNESKSIEERKIHSFTTIRIGGLSFISLLILLSFIDFQQFFFLIFFSFLILILGLVEDLTLSINNYLRLFLLILIISFYVAFQNFYILNFEYHLLSTFLSYNTLFAFLFILIGFLLIINGFNFVDGTNGLLLGMSLLITLILLAHSYNQSDYIYLISSLCFTSILALFIFNFFSGKILTGDGGAYFLGILIGSICIFASKEGLMNEFEIACLIFYPVIEVLFTSLRRLSQGKSPFEPDDLHLHFILYKIIKIKLKNRFSYTFYNSLTSLLILFPLSLIFVIIYFVFSSINFFFAYIILNLLYLINYYILALTLKKLK